MGSVYSVYGQLVVERYWETKDAAPQPIIVRRVDGERDERECGGMEEERAEM